jgi:hypothetical protein
MPEEFGKQETEFDVGRLLSTATQNVVTNAGGKTLMPRKTFLDTLQEWQTSIPLQSLWMVIFKIPTTLQSGAGHPHSGKTFDAEMEKWGEYIHSDQKNFSTDKAMGATKGLKRAVQNSTAYESCIIAQQINIPGETAEVSRVGFDNRGFIREPIMSYRAPLQALTIDFLETNVSYVEHVIRPWLILSTHMGYAAREGSGDDGGQLGGLATDMTIIQFARSGTDLSWDNPKIPHKTGKQKQNRGMKPRKIWVFKDCIPIKVDNQGMTYGIDNDLQTRSIEFNYRRYQTYLPIDWERDEKLTFNLNTHGTSLAPPAEAKEAANASSSPSHSGKLVKYYPASGLPRNTASFQNMVLKGGQAAQPGLPGGVNKIYFEGHHDDSGTSKGKFVKSNSFMNKGAKSSQQGTLKAYRDEYALYKDPEARNTNAGKPPKGSQRDIQEARLDTTRGEKSWGPGAPPPGVHETGGSIMDLTADVAWGESNKNLLQNDPGGKQQQRRSEYEQWNTAPVVTRQASSGPFMDYETYAPMSKLFARPDASTEKESVPSEVGYDVVAGSVGDKRDKMDEVWRVARDEDIGADWMDEGDPVQGLGKIGMHMHAEDAGGGTPGMGWTNMANKNPAKNISGGSGLFGLLGF